MTGVQLAWISLSALYGYLAWRGTQNLWRSISVGLAIPLIGFIALGSFIGRDGIEGLSPAMLFVGIVTASVVLFFICD